MEGVRISNCDRLAAGALLHFRQLHHGIRDPEERAAAAVLSAVEQFLTQ